MNDTEEKLLKELLSFAKDWLSILDLGKKRPGFKQLDDHKRLEVVVKEAEDFLGVNKDTDYI